MKEVDRVSRTSIIPKLLLISSLRFLRRRHCCGGFAWTSWTLGNHKDKSGGTRRSKPHDQGPYIGLVMLSLCKTGFRGYGPTAVQILQFLRSKKNADTREIWWPSTQEVKVCETEGICLSLRKDIVTLSWSFSSVSCLFHSVEFLLYT